MTVEDLWAGRFHRGVEAVRQDAYDFGVEAARRGFKMAWVKRQIPSMHGWREAALRGYRDASAHYASVASE